MIENQLYYDIARQLKAIFENADAYSEVYRLDKKKAEDEIRVFSENKMRAIQGVKTSRDFIINQFVIMFTQRAIPYNENDMLSIIDFDNILNNDAQVIFEMLLFSNEFSYLLNRYGENFCGQRRNTEYRLTEDDIRKMAGVEGKALYDTFRSRVQRLQFFSTLVYAKEYGQDIIDSLQYQNINEIGFLGAGYVYIVYRGSKIHLEFLRFENEGILTSIMKKATSGTKPGFDEQNPCVVASKVSGSRVTVAGFDATPSSEEWYYNERIFNLVKISLEEMMDSYRTINRKVYDILCLNQRGRGSFFVTGSDMGVGKSTFLLAMMEKFPLNWGIGILDTQNELQARKKFPGMNIITLIQNSKLSFAQLFAVMLKMARDVLIVGEITLPQEVAELIKAALRLNAGVGGTLHSISPFEVVTNLRNLMMLTEMYNDAETAEADIARGLDLIIHLARHPLDKGRIIVESIVEIEYLESDCWEKTNEIGTLREKLERLAELAQKAIQKYLFRRSYRYREIIRYDSQTDEWLQIGRPSEVYFMKLSGFVPLEELRKAYEV